MSLVIKEASGGGSLDAYVIERSSGLMSGHRQAQRPCLPTSEQISFYFASGILTMRIGLIRNGRQEVLKDCQKDFLF